MHDLACLTPSSSIRALSVRGRERWQSGCHFQCCATTHHVDLHTREKEVLLVAVTSPVTADVKERREEGGDPGRMGIRERDLSGNQDKADTLTPARESSNPGSW